MLSMIFSLANAIDDPCALRALADIHRLFAWNVGTAVRETFRLPAAGARGSLRTYDGRDGSVVVTIGRGAGLPNDDATNGLARIPESVDIEGLGLPSDIGPSRLVVHDGSHDDGVSVRVGDANVADATDLRRLARATIHRLARV